MTPLGTAPVSLAPPLPLLVLSIILKRELLGI